MKRGVVEVGAAVALIWAGAALERWMRPEMGPQVTPVIERPADAVPAADQVPPMPPGQVRVLPGSGDATARCPNDDAYWRNLAREGLVPITSHVRLGR